jgi:hypothetical protein
VRAGWRCCYHALWRRQVTDTHQPQDQWTRWARTRRLGQFRLLDEWHQPPAHGPVTVAGVPIMPCPSIITNSLTYSLIHSLPRRQSGRGPSLSRPLMAECREMHSVNYPAAYHDRQPSHHASQSFVSLDPCPRHAISNRETETDRDRG